jgi:hypothetical protein
MASAGGFDYAAWTDFRTFYTYGSADIYYNRIASTSAPIASGWNMVSVPDTLASFLKTSVFPGAISPALAYTGSYVQKDTLQTGIGYWIKYASTPAPPIGLVGVPVDKETVNVVTGWNMIGSISSPVGASEISSLPPGIVASPYFWYNGSYQQASAIQPGSGYWVKTTTGGKLVLASSGISVPAAAYLPPPQTPAGEPPAPTLSSPTNGAANVSNGPMLVWNASSGASSYRLQVSTGPDFSTSVYDNSAITNTSQQLTGLAYSTTYFWHVNATNANGTSPWSVTWSFTTAPAQCNCCPQSAPASLTIADAAGNHQTLYTQIGTTSIPMPPVPPDSLLNVRFEDGNYLEGVPVGSGMTSIPIIVQHALSPITISWSIPPGSDVTYSLGLPTGLPQDGITLVPISGSGSITTPVVPENPIQDVITQACSKVKTAAQVPGSEEQKKTPLPTSFSLSENYPNPFNPVTQIRYDLPQNAYVQLKVLDVLGREVASLVDRQEEAGFKSVSFDATNLPSGVYFYRLQAGTFSWVRKMLVTK